MDRPEGRPLRQKRRKEEREREKQRVKHANSFFLSRESLCRSSTFRRLLTRLQACAQTLLFPWQGKRGWPLVRLSLRNLEVEAGSGSGCPSVSY